MNKRLLLLIVLSIAVVFTLSTETMTSYNNKEYNWNYKPKKITNQPRANRITKSCLINTMGLLLGIAQRKSYI